MVAEERPAAVAATAGKRSEKKMRAGAPEASPQSESSGTGQVPLNGLARARATEKNSAHPANVLQEVSEILELVKCGHNEMIPVYTYLQQWDESKAQLTGMCMDKLKQAVHKLKSLKEELTQEARREVDTQKVEATRPEPESASRKRRQRRQRLHQRWALQMEG
jgi:hypothetical protein